uniref:Uncharacterized protein n=1 Tax=Panagrolaimus sp. ES5 TaxID=591445 RepID=A0AC34GAQ3_9BILA
MSKSKNKVKLPPPDSLELPILNVQNGQNPLDRKASSISFMHTKRSPSQEKRRSLPAYKYSKTRIRSFESEDPFNKPEHIITLRGRELVFFVIGYVIAVFFILGLFEMVMPVIFVGENNARLGTTGGLPSSGKRV